MRDPLTFHNPERLTAKQAIRAELKSLRSHERCIQANIDNCRDEQALSREHYKGMCLILHQRRLRLARFYRDYLHERS